jgi:hypothetical protein
MPVPHLGGYWDERSHWRNRLPRALPQEEVARVRHVISILLLLALGGQIGHRCWTTEPEWIGCW